MEKSFRLSGKPTTLLIVVIALLVLVTVLQDFLRSAISHSGFYLSESLLFSSFWWIFLPLLCTQYLYSNQTKRATLFKVLPVLLPVVVHLLAFPVMVWALSAIFYYHTFAIRQTLYYTLSEHLYLLLLLYSLPFLVYNLVRNKIPAKTTLHSAAQEPAEKPITSLLVTEGNKRINLATADILYLTANSPYINIHVNHKKYILSETLQSMSQKLDAALFIRIHKSAIVNRQHIKFYTSRGNGDYDITMVNGEKLRLSRNYVTGFKIKWTTSPQLATD